MEDNYLRDNTFYHIQNYRNYKIYKPNLATDVRYLVCTTELLNIASREYPDIVSEIFRDYLDELPNIVNDVLTNIKKKDSLISRVKSYESIIIGLKKTLNHNPLNEKEKMKLEEISEEINDLISICNNELRLLKNTSTASEPNKKATLKEVALYCYYANLHVSHKNADDIAEKFGYNSGSRLYQNYLKCVSKADRLAIGETAAKQNNKIRIFERAISMLKNKNLNSSVAEKEKKLLEEKYTSFNQF